MTFLGKRVKVCVLGGMALSTLASTSYAQCPPRDPWNQCATVTLSSILSCNKVNVCMIEPPAAVNVGEWMDLTILGANWDPLSVGEWRLKGASGNISDRIAFFNVGPDAKVVFWSDNENHQFFFSEPPPPIPPLPVHHRAREVLMKTFTVNGGCKLYAIAKSDPSVKPPYSDTFSLQSAKGDCPFP